MNDTDLYKLLREWDASHAADDEQLGRLRETIMQSGVDKREARATISANVSARRLSSVLRYGAIGASALALLVAGFLLRSLSDGTAPGADSVEQLASVSDSELHERAKLFYEVQRLFDDDLRWLVNTKSDLQMGLRPVSREANGNGDPILVRTIVLQRRDSKSPWNELMKTDVLTRNEELVELTHVKGSPNHLTLWAYALPDGKILVEAKILMNESVAIGAAVSSVLEPGKPVQVFRLKSKDGECCVFQVAEPLPANERASCYTT